jgi:GNAT superfamily N-acetyltransferase
MEPLLADLSLARRVERAEIEFCALGGARAARLDRLEAGGGIALCSTPGSPLNKVLGLGLQGPVSDGDLDRLAAFYAARHEPAQVELCPLAAPDLPARLVARGFVPQGFENELGRQLAGPVREELPRGVAVVRAADDEEWLGVVAAGFAAAEPHVAGGAEPEAPIDPAALREVMASFVHPDIVRYVARVEGQPAGGGAAWERDGVLGIFGTATLPAFRRRGVQRAINLAALADATPAAELAIATTAPGSTSQRTFERMGFRVLYTRAIFVRPPDPE